MTTETEIKVPDYCGQQPQCCVRPSDCPQQSSFCFGQKGYEKLADLVKAAQEFHEFQIAAHASQEKKERTHFGKKMYGTTEVDWSDFNKYPPQRVGQPSNRVMTLAFIDKILAGNKTDESSDVKLARLTKAIQYQRSLNQIDPPKGVKVFTVYEKTRVVTIAYVADAATQQIFFSHCIYRANDTAMYPSPFNSAMHRYTALMRLYRNPFDMKYQMPYKRVNPDKTEKDVFDCVDRDKIQKDLRAAIRSAATKRKVRYDVAYLNEKKILLSGIV